jgi:hypothetical protein
MKTKFLKRMAAIIAASLMLAACTIPSDTTVEENLAYVTIEINPGLGVMVDEDYRVSYAHALNGDGEMVMLQLQLDGKSLEDAIEEIVEETVELGFVTEETEDPDVELDAISNMSQLQTQTREQAQLHVEAAFECHMIQVQTRTRTYTVDEIAEADAKATTPLKLRLAKQAMIGDPDLLEEEALDLTEKALMNKAKQGATHMKQIAATLGADFLEERKAIQDEYLPQIHELQADIAEAKANSLDTSELEQQLETLRAQMVAEIQALAATYKEQTIQERAAWQTEANIRKGGGNSSQNTTSGHQTSV